MKTIGRIFTVLLALGLLTACVGRFDYVRPVSVAPATLSQVVSKSREDVWRTILVSPLQDRFAINGLDRDAGVITLTYSGDPERYVDCGYITSYVKNVRGERTYRFSAANASAEYELMTGREIVSIERRMELGARIAVMLTPIGEKETRISATVQYILSRTMQIRDTQDRLQTISQITNFSSDQEGTFPGGVVACRPSGVLEADVLAAFVQ